MKNINDIVSFKIAKLAKEKGFDFPTNGNYEFSLTERVDPDCGTSGSFGWKKGEINYSRMGIFINNNKSYDFSNKNWFLCAAPTTSQLQRWLREKHGVWLCIKPIRSHILNSDCLRTEVFDKDGRITLVMDISKDYDEVLEDLLYKVLSLTKDK